MTTNKRLLKLNDNLSDLAQMLCAYENVNGLIDFETEILRDYYNKKNVVVVKVNYNQCYIRTLYLNGYKITKTFKEQISCILSTCWVFEHCKPIKGQQ